MPPSSLLMMEAVRVSETSEPLVTTLDYVPEKTDTFTAVLK